MVPWREILLHKTRREATKVVRWRWRLTEGRWLLVWRERPSEVWRSLFESNTWLSNSPTLLKQRDGLV